MMSRDKPKQIQMRARIAAIAARMMAEDGLDDYSLAKRKAARQLGAADTQALPSNEEIDVELKAYLALYQGEELRERLIELRRIALKGMQFLAQFKPYLIGPVLKGTANRYAEIDLHLFTEDSKSVELFLLNRDIPYEVSEQKHYLGDRPRTVPILQLEWDGVPVRLAVFESKDERGVLKSSLVGRPIERAGIEAVSALVQLGV
jgi:hypothetical protein